MHAFSPSSFDADAFQTFSLPRDRAPESTSRSWIGRLYDRATEALRPEPDLAEMGPSQVHELLVMRGRD
jgi:hypothetical protein